MRVDTARPDIQTAGLDQVGAFAIGDTTKLMQILSDMYEDRLLALVRETTTNMVDSHQQYRARHGNLPDTPPRIICPTSMNPQMVFIDNGVSMDHEAFLTVFTQFGTSTKDQDNEVNGGWGLGAKSPFAYTDSFSVSCRLNGRVRHYLLYKDANGLLAWALSNENDTTKPDGVTVKIPIASEDYRKAANLADVYAFHAAMDVLVAKDGTDTLYPAKVTHVEHLPLTLSILDGQEPIKANWFLLAAESVRDGSPLHRWANRDMPVWQAHKTRGLIVQLGDVPYMLDKEPIFSKITGQDSLKAFVQAMPSILHMPVGSLALTPSRDHLSTDGDNPKRLIGLLKSLYAQAPQLVLKTLNVTSITTILGTITEDAGRLLPKTEILLKKQKDPEWVTSLDQHSMPHFYNTYGTLKHIGFLDPDLTLRVFSSRPGEAGFLESQTERRLVEVKQEQIGSRKQTTVRYRLHKHTQKKGLKIAVDDVGVGALTKVQRCNRQERALLLLRRTDDTALPRKTKQHYAQVVGFHSSEILYVSELLQDPVFDKVPKTAVPTLVGAHAVGSLVYAGYGARKYHANELLVHEAKVQTGPNVGYIKAKRRTGLSFSSLDRNLFIQIFKGLSGFLDDDLLPIGLGSGGDRKTYWVAYNTSDFLLAGIKDLEPDLVTGILDLIEATNIPQTMLQEALTRHTHGNVPGVELPRMILRIIEDNDPRYNPGAGRAHKVWRSLKPLIINLNEQESTHHRARMAQVKRKALQDLADGEKLVESMLKDWAFLLNVEVGLFHDQNTLQLMLDRAMKSLKAHCKKTLKQMEKS